jgi:CheY-like chemotaxis protein
MRAGRSFRGGTIHLTLHTGLGMKRAYPLRSNHALYRLFHYYSLRPLWISLVGLHGRQKRNVTGKQRMLDHEDMKWLAATATALNGFMQKAMRQVEMARLCKGGGENLDALNEQIELASRASQAIFDRITTRILARTAGGVRPGEETSATSASAARASVSTKIPLGEVAANADTASDALILNPKGERELILLVDDDQDVLKVTGEILDFEDYRFILAKDGIEALQIYRQMSGKIDLVLLDYFLPVMDGDAVFDELKAIDPNVRVVLSSGFAEQAKIGSMLARGLHGFIPKPYTREKLVEQIRSVLDA